MTASHNACLLGQLIIACFFTGLIWFVHIVHYPLFAEIGPEKFKAFHDRHVTLTGYVVIVPMLVEAGLAIWWVVQSPPAHRPYAILGAILVAIVWLTTFLGAVPAHERLANGFNPEAHQALLNWNLARSIAWTIRAGMLSWLTWIWIFERSNAL